jgi:hypothetical protein
MAYNSKQLLQQAMEAIQAQRLFFIQDVVDWLGVSKTTFYDHFKINSAELDTIKDALNTNRIRIKVSIRAKLAKGDKAAELLALYKLICTDEERKKLSMTDVNVNVTRDDMPAIDLGRLTKEQRAEFYRLYNLAKIPDSETIDIDHEEIDSGRHALGNGEG